ncbi:MAG: glycosyltransferase family 4 protein [Desulfobacteraceae bacterium]
MKILLVGIFVSPSGVRGVCEDMAVQFSKLNWEVLTTSNKLFRLPRFIDMLGTVWQNRNRYSVAHVEVYSGLAFIWAEAVCWVLRLAKKPYILTLHGGNLPNFGKHWPGRVSNLLQSAALVTTPSNYLLQKMKVYREDLHLIPNALNLQTYYFNLRKQPQPRLIWLRAFHSIYNPQMAPKVVELLIPEFPNIHLTMVGPDKGDGSLLRTERIAKELNFDKHMTLVGKVPKSEVPFWMNQGDIFLNTTNVDNTPVSVMEAMASGLCLVSTNVGGIPYLLEHEKNALLVPPVNPDAMAAAVRRILIEPGLAERLSRNARLKAEQFDWSVTLPQWKALLLKVTEGANS